MQITATNIILNSLLLLSVESYATPHNNQIRLTDIPRECCINTSTNSKTEVLKGQEQKIRGFKDLKVSAYMPEIPTQLSIDTALRIHSIFQELNIVPKKVAASVEGGVLFEYFNTGIYYAIEICNSGEIVKVKKEKNQKAMVSLLSEDILKHQLYGELSTNYGDGRTGDISM